jgi:hypothetical protein
MRLKVRGGTVQHGETSLCVTCRHATIVKGRSFSEEIVQCGRLSSGNDLIRFAVTSCSGYSDRRHPSLWEMEDIAWILRTDPKRTQIGFVQARELDPDERHVLPHEDDE